VLLPSAAGFVDPPLSTGFPLTLLGVSRLAEILAVGWNSPGVEQRLNNYARLTLQELDAAARLVSALYANLPYSESELVPVGLIGSTPYVFVVHPSIPVASFGELIRLLKQNPGKYEFASSSPGTAQHLGGELVKRMAGVDMLHVPYKGSGALLPDLLSGRVPMMFENVAIMTPHIKKGSLKPLAISSAKRSALMPEVPTVAETGQGLEGFEVLGWFALMAPAIRSTSPS
jgi:tripartite-type tricarboxylate transporter receptor subunit TctC